MPMRCGIVREHPQAQGTKTAGIIERSERVRERERERESGCLAYVLLV